VTYCWTSSPLKMSRSIWMAPNHTFRYDWKMWKIFFIFWKRIFLHLKCFLWSVSAMWHFEKKLSNFFTFLQKRKNFQLCLFLEKKYLNFSCWFTFYSKKLFWFNLMSTLNSQWRPDVFIDVIGDLLLIDTECKIKCCVH